MPSLADASWPIRGRTHDPLLVKSGGEVLLLECAGAFGRGFLYRMNWSRSAAHEGGRDLRVVIGTGQGAPELSVHGRAGSRRAVGGEVFLHATHSMIEYSFEDRDGTLRRFQAPGIAPRLSFLYVRLPEHQPQRGTIILLTGLAGFASAEMSLIETFTSRGWAVISCSPAMDTLLKRQFSVSGDRGVSQAASDLAGAIDESLAEDGGPGA